MTLTASEASGCEEGSYRIWRQYHIDITAYTVSVHVVCGGMYTSSNARASYKLPTFYKGFVFISSDGSGAAAIPVGFLFAHDKAMFVLPETIQALVTPSSNIVHSDLYITIVIEY